MSKDVIYLARVAGGGVPRQVAGTIDRIGLHRVKDEFSCYAFTLEGSQNVYDLIMNHSINDTHVMGLARKGDRITVTGCGDRSTIGGGVITIRMDGGEHRVKCVGLHLHGNDPVGIPLATEG